MLVSYIYNYVLFGETYRKVPVGCLVATNKDMVGYSFCCPLDTFNKVLARRIALGRALAKIPKDVEEFIENIPTETHGKPLVLNVRIGDEIVTQLKRDVVKFHYQRMLKRAAKYFSEEEDE